MSFDHLGLRVELLNVRKAKGYTAPTPIQIQAIPVIPGGQDILARAQTGTGKTDALPSHWSVKMKSVIFRPLKNC
jgi:ATP-dependent RNA helicase RhlE